MIHFNLKFAMSHGKIYLYELLLPGAIYGSAIYVGKIC